MPEHKITEFFNIYIESFLKRKTIIKNPLYLSDTWVPEQIKHRDRELSLVFQYIAPLIKRFKSPNLLLYGPTGTGKTLSVKYLGKQLDNLATIKKLPIKYIYINCRIYGNKSSSFYYILKDVLSQLTKKVIKDGIKTTDLINKLFSYIQEKDISVLIVFDEIDSLIKNTKEDDFLYLITRDDHVLYKNRLSFIGISNTLDYLKDLDARTLSSLNAIKIGFKPYNALQLYDILKDRARLAFEEGAISDDILKYIAAWVARESGDARKAISILRLAGNLADAEGSGKVTMKHVERAIEGYDLDSFVSEVETLSTHYKLIVLSILEEQIKLEDQSFVSFTEIYERYIQSCNEYGLRPLSKDSVGKKIKQLETFLGDYMEVYVKSFGKQGRKKVVMINLDKEKASKVIKFLRDNI